MVTLEEARDELESALLDNSNETWTTTELDYFLQRAVTRLSRRVTKPISTDDANAEIALVSGTNYYAIPTDYAEIDAVAYADSNGDWHGYMLSGWEVDGDLLAGTAVLHVGDATVDAGGTLYLRGRAKYVLEPEPGS